MRTLSAQQTTIHQSANRSVHVRVRIDRSSPAAPGGSYAYTGNFSSAAKTLTGNITLSGSTTTIEDGSSATLFTKELSVGAEVTVNSVSTVVTAINSDTQMTVADAVGACTNVAITQNPGSNIVDMSDYKGYNWIKSVEMSHDLDNPVSSASITLVRQIEEMSLSPLITASLPNQSHGVSSPILDITNKFVIETATISMDQSPASSDWVEVFRGYIDEIDWGDSEVTLNCRDLGGKYQDWWMVSPPRDSDGNYTGYGNSPYEDNPLDLFGVMANLLSTQNETYATTTGAHAASYTYNNVDYYLYTIGGDDTSLAGAGSNKKTNTAGTGNVTISDASNVVNAGSGSTKFTTECSVGQGITVEAGATDFSTIIDEIISDTQVKVQDYRSGALTNATFTLDQSPQYIPKRIFDVKDKNLMDAARSMAQSIGWDFRFKWNDDVDTGLAEDSTPNGAFVPTVFCPHRDRVSTNVDFTFSPSLYYDLSSLATSTARIRNHVKVHYLQVQQNSDGDPTTSNSTYVEAENSTSIAKYGRRSMILGGDQGGIGLINTAIEADRLARLALKDLQDPEIIQEIDLPYFWAAEVGDYYKFEANDDHYSSDQTLAVHSITHSISEGEATTSLTCRGKPAGGLNSWLQSGQYSASWNGVGAPTLSVTSDASAAAVSNYNATGLYRLKQSDTTKRITAYNDDARDNMMTQIFPGRKVTLTYNSGGSTLSGTVTSVTHNSDYQGQTGGLTPMYFTLDATWPSGSTTYNDVSVAVTGGRGIVNGSGTTALLTSSAPDVQVTSSINGTSFGGVDFFMATSSGELVEAACQRDSTPFIEGGTYIGEGNRTFTVTGLVPGTTYYFACKYRVLLFRNDPDNGFSWTMDSSGLSNIVTFVARGNNASHRDPNYSDMVQYNPFGDIGSWYEHIESSSTPGTNHRAPFGFNITSGTWGTDFQRNTDTNYIKSGVASIKCPQGASSSAVVETEMFTVPGGTLVRAASNVIATKNASNNMPIFKVELIEYQSDKSSGATTTILQTDGANCPDAYATESDVWHELSKVIKLQDTTRWAKFKISRTTNGNGQFHINDCTVKSVQPVSRFRQGTGRTLTSKTDGLGDLLLIEDQELERFGSMSTGGSSTTTYSYFTAPEDGLYEFNGLFTFTLASSAPSSTIIRIVKNPTVTHATSWSGGTLLAAKLGLGKALISSTVNYQSTVYSGPVELEKGDKVYVSVEANDQLVCVTTQGLSYFVGRRID